MITATTSRSILSKKLRQSLLNLRQQQQQRHYQEHHLLHHKNNTNNKLLHDSVTFIKRFSSTTNNNNSNNNNDNKVKSSHLKKEKHSTTTATNTATVTVTPNKKVLDTQNPTNSAISTEPRSLPTRHSKHHILTSNNIDLSLDDIHSLRKDIMDSIPGTLFAYNPPSRSSSSTTTETTHLQEYQQALVNADATRQKVEYILRGYSKLHPQSITSLSVSHKLQQLQLNHLHNTSASSTHPTTTDFTKVVDEMISLVERLQEEGHVYLELRAKYISQSARMSSFLNQKHDGTDHDSSSSDSSSSSSDDDDDDYDYDDDDYLSKEAWHQRQLVTSFGAPPGLSTTMYDLILDLIALTIHDETKSNIPKAIEWLHKAQKIHDFALKRYDLDCNANMIAYNTDSLPTLLTFNALIRACANAPYHNNQGNSSSIQSLTPDQEQLRDVALSIAFRAFDAMYHHPMMERNSATYTYLLECVGKYLPDVVSKGNISHSLFMKACDEEYVLDHNVVKALLNHVVGQTNDGTENLGGKFHSWVDSDVKDKYDEKAVGMGFPMKMSRFKNTKRFDKRFDVY